MKLYSVFALTFCTMVACSDKDMTGKPVSIVLSAQDLAIQEGETNRPVFLNLQLSAAGNSPVILSVRTVDGTAKAGEDFVGFDNQMIAFSTGSLTQTVRIDIIGDGDAENDEVFSLEFYDVSGAEVLKNNVSVTIENDDNTTTDFTIPATGYSTPESYPGMTLIWQDEFEGPALDTKDWTFESGNGGGGWGNNELQYYRQDNTFTRDGNLVIEARKEAFNGFNYTSSRIITANKFDFKYGRVDIRAVLPSGQGIWPALWTLGKRIGQVGWPECGEIDIMEMIGGGPGRDDTVHGTAHWGQNNVHIYQGDAITLSGKAFQESFHVFSIQWDENLIKWYVDDQLFYSLDITPAQLSEFHENFFLICNVAVGGDWPGSPNASTVFPQRMIIDYIRVFQE